MAGAFLNDLDTDIGGMEGAVQYPTKSQLVKNIAGDPTNAQLPSLYNRQGIDYRPVVPTSSDFATRYTPFPWERCYWSSMREDKVICTRPTVTLDVLMHCGNPLVAEQNNMKCAQVTDAYCPGAKLASIDEHMAGPQLGMLLTNTKATFTVCSGMQTAAPQAESPVYHDPRVITTGAVFAGGPSTLFHRTRKVPDSFTRTEMLGGLDTSMEDAYPGLERPVSFTPFRKEQDATSHEQGTSVMDMDIDREPTQRQHGQKRSNAWLQMGEVQPAEQIKCRKVKYAKRH